MTPREIIKLQPRKLRPALREAWEQIARMEREAKQLVEDVQIQKHVAQMERIQRAAAQRGLVPYVRSLEAFDGWLLGQPLLRTQLEPILRELGLWEIKLGYDPDKDISLSVVSAERR